MLKKSGIILVVLLYLVTATGFALNLHFCGNSIESVKIDAPTKKCGMDSKCCKEIHLQVKVKDAHQTSHTVFTSIILALPGAILSHSFSHKPLAVNYFIKLLPERGPPPSVSFFIKNCTFRI